MFKNLAEDIVFFLITKKVLDQKKREIYEYAMEVLILNSLILITTLIISLLFRKMLCYLMFIVFFIPLRTMLGGTHMKTAGMCMLWSNVLYALVLLVEPLISDNYRYIELSILVITGIVTLGLKSINEDMRGIRNKKVANVFAILYMIIALCACILDFKGITSMMLFILLPEVLFIIGKISKKIQAGI